MKRFYTLNAHLRETFGEKVFKVALDGGFSCPNRDGTVSSGGCSFCSAVGSGDFIERRHAPLSEQFALFGAKMHAKWKHAKYIAYFQAFSNTHAPVDRLRDTFEPVLTYPGVVGISIATRPDCLPDDVIDYLADLNRRTYLWVELGLQTVHDGSAVGFNRGYRYDVYARAVARLRAHGIRVCVHIINGLVGEDYAMMMETPQTIAAQDIQGVKIHLLHLLQGTPLAAMYPDGDFPFLSRGEYVRLVCDQLAVLPRHVVIHRLTGDGLREHLIGPAWSVKKWEILNEIDDTLEARDSYQGKCAV